MSKRQSFQDLHNTIYLNNTISKLATKRVIVIKSNPRTKFETSWDKRKLEIKIRDEGAGYAPVGRVNTSTSVFAKSGRGLRIIAGTADSCTIDDFGREVTLSFLLEDTPVARWLESYSSENTPSNPSKNI